MSSDTNIIDNKTIQAGDDCDFDDAIENNKRSVTIEKAREILKKEGDNYSDKEMARILDICYGFNGMAYVTFCQKKNLKNQCR